MKRLWVKCIVLIALIAYHINCALGQDTCLTNPPFGLSASNTICADSGYTTVTFVIYGDGTYDVSFPDGNDTSITATAAQTLVSHNFLFDCNNMPGNPDPPTADDHYYNYEGELQVVKTDCVDQQGEVSVGYYNFHVIPNPILGFEPINSDCLSSPFNVQITPDLCSEHLVMSYKWYINGQPVVDSLNKKDLKYEFQQPGTYAVKLEVMDYFNCGVYSYEQNVTITAKPDLKLDVNLDSSDLCSPVITLHPINNSKYVDTYQWSTTSPYVSFSDPTSPTPTITIDNVSPGTYSFKLTGISQDCGTDVESFNITTQEKQQVTVSTPLAGCSESIIDICDYVQFSPIPKSVVWKASDANVTFDDSTKLCPSILSNAPGNYQLTIVGKDVCNNDFSETIPVEVTPTQEVLFYVDDVDTLCESEGSIQLLDSNYISPVDYIQDCWGAGVSMDNGCTFDPAGYPGNNTISFLDSCGNLHEIEIYVQHQNGYNGGNLDVCIGDTIDLSTIQSGEYTGVGVTNNIFDSELAGLGEHIIHYDGTAAFCGSEDDFTIDVIDYPEASFEIDNTSCDPGQLVFEQGIDLHVYNSSSFDTYCYEVIETQEKQCGNDQVIFHFANGGEYTIQQIVGTKSNGEGCQDTTTKTIYIEPPLTPIVYTEVDSSSCDSIQIQFLQDSVISDYAYEWSFSNGYSASTPNPVIVIGKPLEQEQFFANLTVHTYCDELNYLDTISLFPRFQVSIDILNDNNTICSGEMVHFVNTSTNYDSIQFFFDDKNIPYPFVDSLPFYNSSDTVAYYPVRLKGFRAGCPPQDAYDTVVVLPINTQAAFSIDYPNHCSPLTVRLKNSSTVGSNDIVFWGDGSTPQYIESLDTVWHTYYAVNDTLFHLSLVSTQCGQDTMEKSIMVFASPDSVDFDALFLNTQCAGDSVQFLPYGEIEYPNSIVWDFGDSTSSVMKEPIHIYDSSGEYSVVLTVTNPKGCAKSINKTFDIFEYQGVPLELNVPDKICVDDSFNIEVIHSEVNKMIDYGNGIVAYEPTTIPYQDVGEYIFRYFSIDPHGCFQDTSVLVDVLPRFDVYTIPAVDTVVRLGDKVTLDFFTEPSRNLSFIMWEGKQILYPNSKIIHPRPVDDGFYFISVVDENGCRAQDSVYVWVDKGYETNIAIPNVFSPNDDGHNDRFFIMAKPHTVSYIESISIYDRWGELIWKNENCQPNNPDCGWDGSLRGKPLGSGVFVYLAKIRFVDGVSRLFVGDLTLIR